MQIREKSFRLFFALWPTDQVRLSITEKLSGISPEIKGRYMRQQNLHITLHFIGQVSAPVKDCLHAAAQSVNGESFQLTLDSFGHFRKAKIFWMGCREMPAQVIQLHTQLGEALENCEYRPDKRPFAPHITLVRKCASPVIPAVDFSIPWEINKFVLVESVTHQEGVEYRVIEEYALA